MPQVEKFNIPRLHIKAEWMVFVCDWHCEQIWQNRVGAVHTAFYRPNSESRYHRKVLRVTPLCFVAGVKICARSKISSLFFSFLFFRNIFEIQRLVW